jgi:hypothetical protein
VSTRTKNGNENEKFDDNDDDENYVVEITLYFLYIRLIIHDNLWGYY